MVVGAARVELLLHGVQSLKDKRSIVRRVVARVRNEFEVSAAETDFMDSHHRAEIGIAVVSNDARVADSVLQKVVNYIIGLHLAEVGGVETGIEHF
jgi:uncharacterized protein YlxP (DUF503 family)